jgi:hypothetical protein
VGIVSGAPITHSWLTCVRRAASCPHLPHLPLLLLLQHLHLAWLADMRAVDVIRHLHQDYGNHQPSPVATPLTPPDVTAVAGAATNFSCPLTVSPLPAGNLLATPCLRSCPPPNPLSAWQKLPASGPADAAASAWGQPAVTTHSIHTSHGFRCSSWWLGVQGRLQLWHHDSGRDWPVRSVPTGRQAAAVRRKVSCLANLRIGATQTACLPAGATLRT